MSKHSVTIAGHRTSVSLEEPFWEALAAIARVRSLSLAAVIGEVDRRRPPAVSLSSALRQHALAWHRTSGDRRPRD